MDIKENLAENSFKIAEKLIQAIERDEQITSSSSLSFQAVKDNLPAICHTVVKAIANNNLSLLGTCENNQGSEHGYVRSGQDFTPEEIVREFFLLKQIVLRELKPQLLVHSPEKILKEIALVDSVINRVMENSFQSYAEARKHQLENLHQQIVTNLLLNAIRYTPSGKIELTCRKIVQDFYLAKESLEIRVSDTGIGIAESDQERIFEPYFRTQRLINSY